MNQLTIRHELHPGRRCGHGMDKQKLFTWPSTCGRSGNFLLDCAGELAASVCAFHLPVACELWGVVTDAQLRRDYNQQTTRLQELGKPCKISHCGIRREDHIGQDADHPWIGDEGEAEAYERDKS